MVQAGSFHLELLNDRQRTRAYIEALRETVRPTDVVVEIGTGTGVLAVAAAQAGARHVYAIEGDLVAETAARVFAANGLEDRITLVRGWSTEITLPHKADLLVTELMGNDPFEERAVPVTHDARQRLLHSRARLLPHRLQAWALVVEVPPPLYSPLVADRASVERWQEWYGIDLSPVAESVAGSWCKRPLRTSLTQHLSLLSDPVLVADINLHRASRVNLKKSRTVPANQAGVANGVLLYFEAHLSRSVVLSTHPERCSPDSNWSANLFAFAQTIEVVPDQELELHLDYQPEFGFRVGLHRISP